MKQNMTAGANEQMYTPLTHEVAATKALADEFVAASVDPDRAMVAFVKVYLLGAAIADGVRNDVLDDLVGLAVAVAHATGKELTFPAVLEEAGEHVRARRVRDAVDAGRARHLAAAKKACATTSLVEMSRIRGEDQQLVGALLQEKAIWASWPGGAPRA